MANTSPAAAAASVLTAVRAAAALVSHAERVERDASDALRADLLFTHAAAALRFAAARAHAEALRLRALLATDDVWDVATAAQETQYTAAVAAAAAALVYILQGYPDGWETSVLGTALHSAGSETESQLHCATIDIRDGSYGADELTDAYRAAARTAL